MRTIKSRAWYQPEKKMIFQDQLEVDPQTQIEWFWRYFCSVEGMIPMQFTGLLDKNGVEIFEGDVVKRDARKYVVKECEASFRLAEGENPGGFLLGDCAPITLEVIGNIHENGDLLK